MEIVLWVVHVLVALGLIGLVMLQQGKGADVGAAFGSGASGTVFGARGSASFLSRTTAILAVIFFITSLSLAYFVGGAPKRQQSVVERAATQENTEKPKAANEQELLNQLSQELQKKPDAQKSEAPTAPAPAAPAPEAPKK